MVLFSTIGRSSRLPGIVGRLCRQIILVRVDGRAPAFRVCAVFGGRGTPPPLFRESVGCAHVSFWRAVGSIGIRGS